MLSKVKSWFKREPWIAMSDHEYMTQVLLDIINEQRDAIHKLRAHARATVRTGSTSATAKVKPKAPAKTRGRK